MLRGMKHNLLISIWALMTACTPKVEQDPRTLVIGIESEIKNLDIRSTVDMNASQVISLFAQSLVQINDQMLPEPELAVSWSDQGSRIFDFQLPKDALFHDGTPLRCQDVLASFQQASSDTSRLKSAFVDVKEMKCVSNELFRIELKFPKASFVAGDVSGVKIMPEAFITSTQEAPPIGSGPYQFVERKNRDIIFKRFDSYKRYKNGQRINEPYFFEKIIVRSVQDPTTRWLSLSSGEIDILINALSQQKVVEAKKMNSLKVYQKPGNSFQYLGFNLRLPKFQNKKVRLALAHAIDRDEIIKHKLFGFAQKASSVLSPLNYFHHPDLKSPEFNPEKSKQLLKEAGFENLELEIKTSTDRDITSIIMVIKEQFERIGVKVTIRPYEFATFFSDIQKGSFEMFSLRWVAVTEPDIMAKIFHSKEVPPGRNRVYYSNPQIDTLVTIAAGESDRQKRKTLYNSAQEIIADDLPYIPLWYPDNIAVSTSKLIGYELSSIGTWASALNARKEE